MSTTTATILVGQAHPNHSGIIPTHFIQFTENGRPALILHAIDDSSLKPAIIPTVENTIDDIFLLIAVYILKTINPSKTLDTSTRESLYDIIPEKERLALYEETKNAFNINKIKIVFNILDDSHLLKLLSSINNYSCDLEVTLTTIKKENNIWTNKTEIKGL
jgi:hypothetical protein